MRSAPSLIFTERVRWWGSGPQPQGPLLASLLTHTHTVWAARAHSESDALLLSLSVARHHGNGKNGRKGRDEKKGCGGGVAMATALA